MRLAFEPNNQRLEKYFKLERVLGCFKRFYGFFDEIGSVVNAVCS